MTQPLPRFCPYCGADEQLEAVSRAVFVEIGDYDSTKQCYEAEGEPRGAHRCKQCGGAFLDVTNLL